MLQSLPKILSHKASKKFISPTEVVSAIDIRQGNRVLEIGNPLGFFAPALLDKVGYDGRVYVAGPNRDSFGKLSHLGDKKALRFTLLADLLTGDGINPGSIDVIFLTNLLSSTVRPDSFCLSIGQYLKADSEVVLIDWDTKEKNVGPLLEQRVSKEDALKLMHKCGMKFKKVLNLSGYHYGLVFGFSAQ
ncbi:MAG: hypothetical protein WCP56_01580 [Candidatus Saccharibacteria bacterium]|jgi:hypothetical protein